MMRSPKYILMAALGLAATPVLAQSMSGDMKDMPGMTHDMHATKSGQGVGTVTAVDAKAGTLTINHGPIAALQWPAMTMSFKANPASLLGSIRAGQKVRFTVTTGGAAPEVTAIQAN